MSGVFKRFRKKTGIEVFDLSTEAHVELLHYMMREKNVPKRYRFIYTIPILVCDTLTRIFITQANTIYPTTQEMVDERKRIAQKAINFNETVIRLLQDMIFGLCMESDSIDKLDRIGEILVSESKALRGWRRDVRILHDKKQ